MTEAPIGSVQIHADHDAVKHLGNWTSARVFEVKARYSQVVLDLRSPGIEVGDIEISAQLDHAVLKLLAPDDAVIDQTQLVWTGRGKVKDSARPDAATGRHIRLTGQSASSEIRVNRGGVAILSAMFSREYLEDVRQAHREGTVPTVDDPTRSA